MKKILLLLFCLLIINSCRESSSPYFSRDFLKDSDGQLTRLDTILLSDSINYFNLNVYADQYTQDKILAAQIPSLSFYLLNSNGKVVRKISQNGQGPGLLGNSNFGLGFIGHSGRIYILTAGNSYQLFVFDSDGEFIHRFPLFKFISEVFVPPVNSSFEVIENEDNTLLVTFSTGSSLYPPDSREYFEKSTGIAQFAINMDSLKVTDYYRKLPLIDLPEIKEALSDEVFYWQDSYPVFDFDQGLFYLAYAFSNKVLVYNQEFELLNKIKIKTLESIPQRNFDQKLILNKDNFLQRTVKATRRRKENLNIQRINIKGDQLVIQFPEILREGEYELPSISDINGSRKVTYPILQHAIFMDLKTTKERFVTFPEDHFSITIIDERDFLIHTIPKEKEEVFLLKYRLNK